MDIKYSVITICSILVMSSCGSGNNGNETLENSNNLLALQQEVIDGDTLYGVRTIFDTIQVVPFDRWDSIKAVSPEVVKAYKSGSMFAYTARGQQMGGALTKVEVVTTSTADSTTFYKGVAADADKTVFYFPASNSIIDAVSDMYIGRTVALFQTTNGWDVRDYGGSLLWQVESADMVILRRIYAEEETMQVAILSKNGAEIYDTKGNLVAEVPMAEWKKATKNFRRTATIGSANYGELDINYQF